LEIFRAILANFFTGKMLKSISNPSFGNENYQIFNVSGILASCHWKSREKSSICFLQLRFVRAWLKYRTANTFCEKCPRVTINCCCIRDISIDDNSIKLLRITLIFTFYNAFSKCHGAPSSAKIFNHFGILHKIFKIY